MRATVRRSIVTKWIITNLLIGAGLLAFLVLAGESDPETSFSEILPVKLYAIGVMAVDVLLWKVAYREHLLIGDIYKKERV